MSTYLIDFENVKSGGLTGMDHIKKEDSVHLFWSTRENKISIEMMEQIRNSESEIVMHKAVTGERDALDHQLCSYLGLLAGEKEETDFVIVSNDKAYDHLIEFWRRMNDAIHIQRVSEIAKVSMSEGESGKEEELLSEELTASESKNSRRRERGGRYLKGNRKGTRRMASESAPAAVTEEQAFGKMLEAAQVKEDQVKEEASEDAVRTEALQPVLEEPAVLPTDSEKEQEPETKSPEKPTEAAAEEETPRVEKQVEEVEAPAQPEKKQPRKPSAYVVTGIRTGIVVESGFTADGILEGTRYYEEKHTPVEEKKAEAGAETPVSKATGKEKSAEKKEGKHSSESRSEASPVTDQKPAKETAGEEISEKEILKEETPEKEIPKEVKEETLSKDPQAEAVAETEETEKLPEHAEGTDQEEKGKKAAKPVRKRRTSRPAKTGEGAKSLETEKEAAPAHPARKRGRPKKEERPERLPEVRIPIMISDVVAKCPEADGAEWTAEVVNLINHSKDKKELYASIVRLLGQEKGRTVYHAIKILK